MELSAQRYLDRWLLRLQRHLDSRRYLWQLPWYMVVGPAGSGKTALLREGFPADIIYTPEAVRGTGQRLYITPHVGKQAVIFDPDGVLCEQQDTEVLPRRLWEHWLGWLVQKRARQPLNGLILTLDLPDLLTADKHRRDDLIANFCAVGCTGCTSASPLPVTGLCGLCLIHNSLECCQHFDSLQIH